MNHYAIRDEYAPTFGRQRLTLWSGDFASTFEGWATELPGHDGFMVQIEYGDKIRVTCESPRTDGNYMRVDDAINAALRLPGRRDAAPHLPELASPGQT